MGIAEHLHFDMAGRGDPLLQQHLIIAETRFGLALAAFQISREILRRVNLAHTLAAAACNRLDQHGITNRLGLFRQAFERLILTQIAWSNRHTSIHHQLLGSVFQTHRADAFRLGPDPD